MDHRFEFRRNWLADRCVGLPRCAAFFAGLALLGIAAPVVAQTESIGEMFRRMTAGKDVTGVTVVTHGFQFFDNGGDSLMPLAQAVRSRIAQQTGGNVWLLDYDVADDHQVGVFDLSGGNVPAEPTVVESGQVVLLYDWAPESNRTTGRWADSAGDALFSLMAGMKLIDPHDPTGGPDVHMIAHSFGSGVNSEAVERMARYDIPVSQMTFLDPHDFDQAGVPVDENQRIFDMGRPNGYGATVWDNVDFADVYYQVRGNQASAVGLFTDNPEGRPIPGAHNRLLTTELPAGNPYVGTESDHSYVWNTFYQGTVEGARPRGTRPPGMEPDYGSTGWAYSVHNQNRLPIDDTSMNFYDASQDHEHSEPSLVNTVTGQPNQAGLTGIGRTAEQIRTARWSPQWTTDEIANGDFDGGGANTLVSGWTHHGGNGEGHVESESVGGITNRFMQLDFADEHRTHNYLYVPPNASELLFEARVSDPSDNDAVRVTIGDEVFGTQELGAIDVTAATEWQDVSFEIPPDFRGTSTTFRIDILADGVFNVVDTELDIDSFRFGMLTPELTAGPPPGSVIDFGVWPTDVPITLEDVAALTNIGEGGSEIDVYDMLSSGGAAAALFSAQPIDTYIPLIAGERPTTQLDLMFAGADTPGVYTSDFTFLTTEGNITYTLRAEVVPEPATLLLMFSGLAIGLVRRVAGRPPFPHACPRRPATQT